MTTAKIRVLIVDDQALFRSGIRMLLSSQSDMDCVGEAADGIQAQEMVRLVNPDVVLMDVRMPVQDGITATEAILLENPDSEHQRPRIIVLTTFELDEAAAKALRAGASGFLLKDAEPEFLLAAIRSVHAGNSVVASKQTAQLLQHHVNLPEPVPERFQELTERETEIFQWAAQGLSNTEIAERAFLSEATVKTHMSRILSKLQLRDRVQLVVFAYQYGLVV
ncbi:MAG: response regulator transcription factor [Microbacteriaceae bacterium]